MSQAYECPSCHQTHPNWRYGRCPNCGEPSNISTVSAPAERLYYIRNLGYVGNCLRWWRKEGGYTCDLRLAGQFTEGEALGIIRVRNGEDIAYPVSEIDSRAQLHVTDVEGIQKLAPADGQVASGGNRKAS